MAKEVQYVRESRFKVRLVSVILLVAVAAGGWMFWQNRKAAKQREVQVELAATLRQVIQVNELSTFTAVYNGVAEVYNKEDPEKIDRYVSYEGRIYAGIDFEKIEIEQDDAKKVIRVKVPDAYIIEAKPVYESMEFIDNVKDKDATISTPEASRACQEDMDRESRDQQEILSLAKQNAVNIITAWTKPFVEQCGEGYTLIVE